MSVRVEFPDGTERDVSSRTEVIESREIPPGPPTYNEVPLFDPKWRFQPALGGRWFAFERS